MRTHSIDFLSFYEMSTGRRLTISSQTLSLLLAMDDEAPGLKGALESSLAHDKALFAEERRWEGRKRRVTHGEKAQELDQKLDRLIAGVFHGLDAQIRLGADRSERAAEARGMFESLFPRGLAEVTQGSFSEQAHTTNLMLEAIDEEPRFQKLAAEIGLSDHLALIRELNAEYLQQIAVHQPPRFEDLEAKRRQGQILFGSALMQIFLRYPGESPAELDARARLLGPAERQNEALRALYKERSRRRSGAEPIAEIEPELAFDDSDKGTNEAA